MTYGIYDKEDNCWIGGDDGPKLFEEKALAGIAAQMVAAQLGHPAIRYEGREFEGGNMRLKEKVDAKMSPLEALKRVEMGRV